MKALELFHDLTGMMPDVPEGFGHFLILLVITPVVIGFVCYNVFSIIED